ncbi:MAG TPA: AAA family ATPase, partial [Oligoflexia bacterium]|nr:AAA family ATPase [Oligoflexia bacterium]
ISYQTQLGPFARFCQIACRKEEAGEQFVFVIDEVNRGNVSRIFGELMFLLEYRDQELPLLYSRDPFRIPRNLTIIATMNSADRSIALIDYALRRRFRFIEFQPRTKVLQSWYKLAKANKEHDQCLAFFEFLNCTLSDPKLKVGHSYFLDATAKVTGLTKEKLKHIWEVSVWPLLQEYFVSMPSRLPEYSFETLWKKASADRNENLPTLGGDQEDVA